MEAPDSIWMPFKAKYGLANTHEDIAFNIRSALKMEFKSLQEFLGSESGAVSIVGSGPSLKKNWMKLRDSNTDIIACNAACQFLLERGIVPKFMFCFDADPLVLEFFTNPHPEITYLISSRCVPKVFEMLKDHKVVVWHASGDKDIESILQEHGLFTEPMIAGGTAAVTRAMVLGATLGYMTVHLWGADSSFSGKDTHIRKSTTDEKMMSIMMAGKVFEMAPWMTAQCDDFKALAPILKALGVRLIVHGDGIIPYLAHTLGYETDLPAYRRILGKVKTRSQLFWNAL